MPARPAAKKSPATKKSPASAKKSSTARKSPAPKVKPAAAVVPARPAASGSLADPARLQAWWSHRQGLDGGLAGASAAEVLQRTGWARSVGGVGPYLGLFARAGLTREQVDAAVAQLHVHELPSARGCTYVVPSDDYALALEVGQGFGEPQEVAMAKKHLAVTDAELEGLCRAVLDALAHEALDPRELKERLGGVVRNLGEEGKKRGMTTTLPLALGLLQAAGDLRRVPTNGRLDQQRYRYVRWSPGPLAGRKRTPEQAHTELARRFFRWAGPATLAELQGFTGLGVKQAQAAVAPLGLVPLEDGDARRMLPGDREALAAFRVPEEPRPVLVSSLDGLVLLRRNVASLLAHGDEAREVFSGKGTRSLGALSDLPSHAILDRGRLVGLWEYDAEQGELVWASFEAPTQALKEAVRRTEAFVREQLGDARSFSLDSPQSRAPRLAALRKAARRPAA